jgi:hypothetical protein
VRTEAVSYADSYSAPFGNSDSHSHRYAHGDGYSYGATEPYADCHRNGYIYDHAECYGNCYFYNDGGANPHGQTACNTEATSNASAATDVKALRGDSGERGLLACRSRQLVETGTTSPLSVCCEECCRQGRRQLQAGSLCSPESAAPRCYIIRESAA